MTPAHPVSFGGFALALDHPPVFLAEIGGFFGQDIGLARAMIERVIAVSRQVPRQPMMLKTEVLHDAEICLPGDTLETYAAKDGRVRKENYRALIERKVLPLDHYAQLFALCRDAGLPFVVSVYDFAGADFAVDAGTAALKIASSNVVHVPLIRHAAGKGLPLVLDTGRATLTEVRRAVALAREAGCEDIVVEHSPDGHPALPKAHNMRLLQTYREVFGLPVGLSDHHVGVEMLYLAIALGATVLEKGVHVAPDELDIDISHTMGLDDLPRVLTAIHDCWQAMGRPERDPGQPIEGVIGTSQRQCLVARRNLKPGERISLETVRFAFPRCGIGVEDWDLAEGRTLATEVLAGAPIQWADVHGGKGTGS